MSFAIGVSRRSPLACAVTASADVVWVDEGGGFCASVLRSSQHRAVARLDISIIDAPHEGQVLRWTMLHAMPGEPGLYVYDQTAEYPPVCPLALG